MAMQLAYLVSVRNLPKFLEAIRHAQTPAKFTLRFIEELGFTSTNDRLFIPLFKAMKFVDEPGKPTARYHAFLDDTQWKFVLAEGIKDAYADLFRVNRNANTLTREAIAGKIKSLSEGKASEVVVQNSTRTFLELVKLADFSGTAPATEASEAEKGTAPEGKPIDHASADQSFSSAGSDSVPTTLVYRIEIILPAVRDQAVYDAIFRAAKQHLLK